MKQSQLEFGHRLIKEVANKWGVTVEQAALILLSPEKERFGYWIHAIEYLEEELYKDAQ
jgi:hypothetical protein